MASPRIVVLTGPTGVGKTELGLAIAARWDAEIVCADSRQVYRGLDIGTAKPTLAQRAAIAHHVIDVAEPDEPFDCARFRQAALGAIDDIAARGKPVLVVGGTGLYVKVLRGGLFPGPPRDPDLRARLLAAEDAAPGTLHRRLQAVDPARAARLHPHDRVRLVRALEVHALTGRPISAWQADHGFRAREMAVRVLVVSLPRAALYARIDRRCGEMIEAGLAGEVRGLYRAGFSPALAPLRSPGYREIGEYVRGLCDLPTAVARMAQATRRLAKRQLTWFRGDPAAVWCAPDQETIERAAARWWGTSERPPRRRSRRCN